MKPLFSHSLRTFALGVLMAVAFVAILPLAASGNISTGPGGDLSWYWENPLPQGDFLKDASFVDNLHGWVVGQNGAVLRTSDGGVTWTYLDPRVSAAQYSQRDINGVTFADTSRGWIAGAGGLIKRTADGGATWTTQTVPVAVDLNGISSWNASAAIAVGKNYSIAYTTDAGATWRLPATNPLSGSGALQSVSWATTTTAYAVGDNGTIVRTTDGGATWAIQASGTTRALTRVQFAPGTTEGYAVGLNGTAATVLRTTTGGASWGLLTGLPNTAFYGVDLLDANNCVVTGAGGAVYVSANAAAGTPTWTNRSVSSLSGPGMALTAVQFADATHIFAFGDAGATYLSADAGVTWTTPSSGTSANLMTQWFADTNTGWAAGASGTILRTTNAGVGWVGTMVGTGTWRGISFANASSGFVVGDAGAIRATTDGGVTWAPQTSGTTVQLNAVWCPQTSSSPTLAIAVGRSGTILRTTNGGSTWTALAKVTGNDLNGAYMTDALHGWAVGSKSTILYTADGGATWVAQAGPQKNKTLNAVRGVAGTNDVWIVGNAGLLWSTTDGTNWTNQTSTSGTTQNLYSVYFRSTSLGWISGAAGTVRYWTGSGTFTAAATGGLPAGTTVGIHSVLFSDANTGYYAADAGSLRKSLDGGKNWVSQQYTVYSQLNDVAFPDLAHGWIAGSGGTVIASSDGGNSWFLQTSGVSSDLYGVSFSDASNGLLVGASGVIRHTANGGNAWSGQSSGTTQTLNGVSTRSGDTGHAIAVGNSATILRTSNGGSTWAAATAPANTGNITAVEFPETATAGIALATCDHAAGSGAPGIIRTTDYGATWSVVSTASQPFASLDFAPAPAGAIGWAVGASGTVYKTTDTGLTWTAQTSNAPGNVALSDVSVAATQAAYAFGDKGVILRTADGGATWVPQNSGWGSASSNASLRAAAFADSTHGFTVGTYGTILRTTQQLPPVTSLIADPSLPDGGGGWYLSAPSISLVPDQQAQTYYSWDSSSSGAFSAYAAPITAPDGIHTLYYYSVNAGNYAEGVQSAVFHTDTTAPSAPGGILSATAINNQSAQVSFTQSATDNASGIDYYEIWYQANTTTTPSLGTTISVLANSGVVVGLTPNTTYNFWFVAVDVAGNSSVNSPSASAKTLALSALVTSATVVPPTPNGQDSFYVNATPTVSLSVTPTVAAWTYYAWDSAALSLYTTTLTVPAGVHTLSYFSKDQAGLRGQENTRTLTLRRDDTPPSVPASVTASGLTTSTASVSWASCVDTESGVDHYAVFVNGSQAASLPASVTTTTLTGLSVNATYTVYVLAANGAGLTSQSTTTGVHTFANAPIHTLYASVPATPDGASGWYVSTPIVSLTSTPSAVPAWTYYWWGAASPATYTPGGTLAPSGDGTSTLSYYSVDKADAFNHETTQALTLKVDRVAPSAPASISASTVSTTAIAVSWTVGSDPSPGSGVDHYAVYVDGVAWGTSSGTSLQVTGLLPNTMHTFRVATVDVASNSSGQSAASAFALTDAVAARYTTVNVAPPAPNGANSWYVTTPTVSLTATPTDSWTLWGWDSSALTTYTVPFDALVGVHTLSYWSIDQAMLGSPEPTNTLTLKVDPTPPSAPSTVSASAASTSSVSVGWASAADPDSGIARYAVYVGGSLVTSIASPATGLTLSGLAVNTTHTVAVAAVNGAGLQATSSAVTVHTLPDPAVSTTSTVSPANPDGFLGWYVATPEVTLAPLPADIPCTTYFWWGTGSPAVYSPGTTLTPPGDGPRTLSFYSVDDQDATNREATRTLAFDIDRAAPIAPDSVTVSGEATTSMIVSWAAGSDPSPGSGLNQYVVYIDGVAGPTTSSSVTETVITGLLPDTIYTLQVASVDLAGNSSGPSSAFATASTSPIPMRTTTATVTPATPDGANNWYVTTPTISLSVTPTPSYTFYRWDAAELTTYTTTLDAPEGMHWLSFWSVDQAFLGLREATNTLGFAVDTWPDVTTGTPSPAGAIVASAPIVGDTAVLLRWAPPNQPYSGQDHYEINGDATGWSYSNSYWVTGLTASTPYQFRVIAVSGAGTRYSMSATVSVTTSAPPLPDPPALVAAQAPNGEEIFVDWVPASGTVGAVSYQLWRSTDGVKYAPLATLDGLQSTSYTDAGLRSSTRYWYAVTTTDGRGVSSMSDTSTAAWANMSAVTRGPQRPEGLRTVAGSGTVVLDWLPDLNPAVTGYYVLRSDASLGEVTTLTVAPLLIPGYTDDTLQNDRPYYYSIVAMDASGTVGLPSLEVEARAQETSLGEQPHLTGYNGSSCICHAMHTGVGKPILRFSSNRETMCYGCHKPYSAVGEYDDPLAVTTHGELTSVPPTGDQVSCMSCHRPVEAPGQPLDKLLLTNGDFICIDVTGTPPGPNGYCYRIGCHGAGSTLPQGDMRVFDTSAHSVVATTPDIQVACDVCHESHASHNDHLLRYSSFMVCVQCHNGVTSGPPDLWSQLQASEETGTMLPILPQNQAGGGRASCQNCHNTHAVTSKNPLVDPHDPSPAGAWTGPLDDLKTYCFRCHNGSPLPTAAETGVWADPVLGTGGTTVAANIQLAYDTNVHGYGTPTDTVTTQAHLRPDMGYGVGAVLKCESCHETHGSSNRYGLKTTVVSANGAESVSGLLVYRTPSGGHDMRFFCNACHVWDPATHDSLAGTSTAQFPVDCTRCHTHLNADGTGCDEL
jgi:predicted CXXCH cytochrome family protein